MTGFRFPLETALRVRRLQADMESVHLERIEAETRGCEAQRDAWARQADGLRQSLVGKGTVSGAELAQAAQLLPATAMMGRRWSAQLGRLREQAEAQRARVADARRQVKLLETLRERAEARWRVEVDREVEATAAEAHLARLMREGRPERGAAS